MSVLDRIKNRPDRTSDVVMALDPNDADRLREARSALVRAKSAAERKPEDMVVAGELVEAQDAYDAVEAEVVTLRFDLVAIGPRRFEELMAAHPATKDQRTKARQAAGGDPKAEPQWDEDTFPPALLSEAITKITVSDGEDPPQEGVSLAQMGDMWAGRMSVSDRAVLFQTAVMLNQAPTTVDAMGKG